MANTVHNVLSQAEIDAWAAVPSEVRRLVKLAVGPARIIQTLAADMSDAETVSVWYEPDSCNLVFHGAEKTAEWVDVLSQVPYVGTVLPISDSEPPADTRPWLLLKQAFSVKQVAGPIAALAGQKPGLWPTAPNTLTATLGSSLLGAGAGYGVGWLADQLLPKSRFRRGRLPLVGAVAGGLAGGVPSLMWGLHGGYRQDPESPEPPTTDIGMAKDALCAALSEEDRQGDNAYDAIVSVLDKQASGPTAGGGGAYLPIIHTDQFNKVIWGDEDTPAAVRAAASGLVTAASLSRGGAKQITPLDIVNVGLGAKSGYVSALLVGKTLGALAGLNPETQQTLQQIGVWSGILSNIVPLAFGG